MAVCNTSSLMADAACFACLPAGQMEAIKLSLLCRIAQSLDATMTCDVQALMTEAACFNCLPTGMLQIVQTQLLCNVAAALAGGIVSDAVTCGAGVPTVAPSSGCGVYYDTTNSALYIYTGGAWQLKV